MNIFFDIVDRRWRLNISKEPLRQNSQKKLEEEQWCKKVFFDLRKGKKDTN